MKPCEQLDPHQRKCAERAELVYWRPWELLIAHGKSDDESAEMLSWGRVWLIERRSGALADAFPCRNGVTACSIRAWLLRVAVHNPASHGKHACGRVCVRAYGRVCVLLFALEGLRRARAVLRASRVMREAVHALVR